MKQLFLLLLGFSPFFLSAQITGTVPEFPKASLDVVITFDASQGSGGLAGYAGDVYAHTGVITDQSTGPADWKYVKTDWGVNTPETKLTRISGDVYELSISPNIRDYYGVPNGEEILQISLVFRSAGPEGGSYLEGKDAAGSDIYVDVYPEGLATSITNPSSAGVLLDMPGETIAFEGIASESADLSLYDNNVLVASATASTSLTHTFSGGALGNHLVEFIATDGTNSDTSSFVYIVATGIVPSDPPAGSELGISYTSSTSARLVLQAPNKDNIFVIGDFNNWNMDANYLMKKSTDGNLFWIELTGLNPGEQYGFQYLIDGDLRIADPMSELILDPNNDQYINNSTFPDIPDYPNGKTNGIVTILQTDEPAYTWNHSFTPPAKEDLVIYELHLRDFLAAHDYNTLQDTLDYIQRLGINAIEFMPVNEFSGNDSWGYNPTFHMALDKYYGTKNDFKAFIDECHSRGIAIILDVVYNHIDGYISPIGRMYWDDSTNKPTPDNPWLNVEAKHPFNVFNDMNHENQLTKDYIDRTMRYWINEYKIDGFRFDLSKGLTQFDSGSNVGAWGNYDASRVNILKDYADICWAEDNDFYVILEHFANNTEEKELSNYGMMLWGNANHNYNEAAMGFLADSDFKHIYSPNRSWSEHHLIGYMESHDEERIMYKNLKFGAQNPSEDYTVRRELTALQRTELANAFFYTIPGPKMLWQFGEVGYQLSINHCSNGTEDESCRTSAKPILWNLTMDDARRKLYNVVADLIHLKTNYEVFKNGTISFDTGNNVGQKSIKLEHSTMDVVVVGNFDVSSVQENVTFTATGTWHEYFSGESIDVDVLTQTFDLQPGEYRLYTTTRVDRPSGDYNAYTDIEDILTHPYELNIAPNPNKGQFNINFNLPQASQAQVQVLDLTGKTVYSSNLGRISGEQSIPLQLDLDSGVYFVQLLQDNLTDMRRIVITK